LDALSARQGATDQSRTVLLDRMGLLGQMVRGRPYLACRRVFDLSCLQERGQEVIGVAGLPTGVTVSLDTNMTTGLSELKVPNRL